MRLWLAAILAALAGAVAALGHPPLGFWPATLLGFLIVFHLWKRVARPVPAGLVGWAAGAGYFAVALHWIVEPFLVDAARHGWMAPFALVFMAGGLALFWGLAALLAARLGGQDGWSNTLASPGALVFALALALAEMARGYLFTGFPWALPGYVWLETPVRFGAALVGPYGLTAATLLVCSVGAWLSPWPFARGPGVVAIILGASFAHVALAGLENAEVLADGKTVRIVQPNVPQDEKWDRAKAPVFLQRLMDMSAERAGPPLLGRLGVGAAPDLIVWPESAVPYPLDLAGDLLREASEAARGVPIITGLNRRTMEGDWFNSLAVVESGGTVIETYDKVHLVPFGEYIPGRIDLLRRMAAFSGFGFSAGEAVRAIDTPLGRAVPLICYEAIFPRHIGRAGERPDYLLQITNDAWFGTFAGPQQHLAQARFRAIEQGLPLVRAANTGISAVIGPFGEVRASIALGEAGYVDADVPGALVSPTLYARMGDVPVALVLAALLGGLVLASHMKRVAPGFDPQ